MTDRIKDLEEKVELFEDFIINLDKLFEGKENPTKDPSISIQNAAGRQRAQKQIKESAQLIQLNRRVKEIAACLDED